MYTKMLEEAQAVLKMEDKQFQVDVVIGPWEQHHIKTLQEAE